MKYGKKIKKFIKNMMGFGCLAVFRSHLAMKYVKIKNLLKAQ